MKTLQTDPGTLRGMRAAAPRLAVLIGLVLVAASCGSDGGVPESSPVLSYPPVEIGTLTSLQQRAVDLTYNSAVVQGLVIDADCMRSVGAQLSEADAGLIVAALPGESVDLSAQGASLTFAMRNCVRAPTASAPSTTPGTTPTATS